MAAGPLLIAVVVAMIVAWSPAIASAAAADEMPGLPAWITELAIGACRSGALAENDVVDGVAAVGDTVTAVEMLPTSAAAAGVVVELASGAEVRATIRLPGTAGQRTRVVYSSPADRAGHDLLVQAGPGCEVELARLVERDDLGRPLRLIGYRGDPPTATEAEDLNPPVPDGTDPGGVAVATIDTGIAYTLPLFAERLARDAAGRILGYDFADDDDRPFDLDPSRPAVFPVRHGTAVTSIVLREAPEARLVPLRYPAGEPEKFAAMVDHIAAGPARIVAMPLGGAAREEWEPFAAAVRRHPEILFMVSAGNDGRDVDADPLYPAAFDLDNVLVVTSTDAFGRLAPDSNWGARSVDIAVPGERIDVTDHRGAAGKASGSSYAVPRVAALAARLESRHPGYSTGELKAAIVALAIPIADASRPIAAGWIPNPAIE